MYIDEWAAAKVVDERKRLASGCTKELGTGVYKKLGTRVNKESTRAVQFNQP